MMLTDPNMVRWSERVKAGKATIDGVPIADKKQARKWGRELADVRAAITVDAINMAIAAKCSAAFVFLCMMPALNVKRDEGSATAAWIN